jgi:hypothetical protein
MKIDGVSKRIIQRKNHMDKKAAIGFLTLATALATGIAFNHSVFAADNFSGGQPPRGGNMQQGGGRGGNGQPGQDGPQGQGQQMMSSKESMEACDDKSEGDDCSFTSSDPKDSSSSTTVSGTCAKMPARPDDSASSSSSESKLSCVPEKKDGDTASGETELERAKKMKTERKAEIYRIESRTEKMISFLGSKDVDDDVIDDINDKYDNFKDKADTLLEKYDDYIDVLGDDDASDDDISDAQDAIKSAGKDMMDYFTGTLRKSIQAALDDLED